MENSYNVNFGKLFIRLYLGFFMLFHGYKKLLVGTDKIESLLIEHGIPKVLAYGVYFTEIIIPILLIIGYFTRFSAFILILNMILAIYLVHSNDLFNVIDRTGGLVLELQYFYIFTALAVILLGPGKFSLDKK